MKKMQTRWAVLVAVSVVLAFGGLASAAHIIWVTDDSDGSDPPSPDDIGFKNLLEANGHTVDRQTGRPWRELDAAEITALNAADLVIVSRDTDSGAYSNNDAERGQWNGVTTPLMLLSQYLVRNSRWRWLNTGSNQGTGDGVIKATDTGHDIFQNVTLGAGDTVDIATSSTPKSGISNVGNGQLLAVDPDDNNITIAFWPAGTVFYNAANQQTAGGDRMFFGAGFDGNNPKAAMNLTGDGEQIFLDAVDFLAPSQQQVDIPEPATMALLGLACAGLGGYVRRRKRA